MRVVILFLIIILSSAYSGLSQTCKLLNPGAVCNGEIITLPDNSEIILYDNYVWAPVSNLTQPTQAILYLTDSLGLSLDIVNSHLKEINLEIVSIIRIDYKKPLNELYDDYLNGLEHFAYKNGYLNIYQVPAKTSIQGFAALLEKLDNKTAKKRIYNIMYIYSVCPETIKHEYGHCRLGKQHNNCKFCYMNSSERFRYRYGTNDK